MYYPYFRGKQYELIAIRENAEVIAQNGIVPIIEPVRETFSGVRRAIQALVDAGGRFVLVINPQCGDLFGMSSPVDVELLSGCNNCSIGFIVHARTTAQEITALNNYGVPVSIIHNGFAQGRELATMLRGVDELQEHIFIEESCSRLYRRHFNDHRRVLIRDGFIKRKNREHPPLEHFSDLHITYPEEGVDGFGDFLIVGDDFSEGGGPAFTVAIHLTLIDSDEDDDMFMKHYISDRQLDPTDPGGKFLEALNKLADDVHGGGFQNTTALGEFMELHSRRHFPGLGYVKKLSMQHHIETLAAFLSRG